MPDLKMKFRALYVDLVVWAAIFLFVFLGLSKFLNLNALRHDMLNQPIPYGLARVLMWLIPACEIMLSLILVFRRLRTVGLWGSFVLVLIYTLYTGLVLIHFFDYVPCSCGGILKFLSWSQNLVFDCIVLILVGLALYWHCAFKKLMPGTEY